MHKYKINKASAADFMPQGEVEKQILVKRANQLAKIEINKAEQESLTKYIRFRLGQNEVYGIPYEKTKEVMNNRLLTRMPNVPLVVAGVINRRGALIAVIDLKKVFHITAVEEEKSKYIIIVTGGDMVVGILVDDIEGSDVYNSSLLDPPVVSQEIPPEYILGINQGNTTIINIDSILACPSLHLNAKSQGK